MSENNNSARVTYFTQQVIKWRWLVLLGTLAFAFLAASGGRFLSFNNDYHIFFGEDNPQLKAFDALQEKYTKDDNIFIAIAPKDGRVFTNETLAAIEELTALAWKTPYSTRVDAISNFQHTRSVDDDLYVEDLVADAATKSAEEISAIKRYALRDPVLRNRLINGEASVTAVNITLQLPGKEIGEETVAVEYVREIIGEFEQKHPNLKTYISGMVMLSDAFGEAGQKDVSTLIPLMFLTIILTIYLLTRSISGTSSALVLLIMSIMTAMGLAGWLGIQLTSISISAPTMILTLAVADSIHILISMLQFMRRGQSKNEAIVQSLRINMTPVFLTSLTTVIGFLTMNFSDSPPFHDLGNITAMGMTAAFLFSVTTLPALMAILPVKVKVASVQKGKVAFLDRLAEFVIRNNRKLLWSSTAIVLAVGLLSFSNEMNEDFVSYFDESIQFRTDTDFISENLIGIYTIEFSLNSGGSDDISDPEYLKKLEEFENWFKKQEGVIHVNAFTEVARRVNKSMHGDQLAYYRLPEARDEAAQYLLLYEMSLPYGLDLNNQINVDKSETRFTVSMRNVTSNQLMELTARAEHWLRENAPEHMSTNGISTALMFSHLTQRQVYSMAKGSVFAILLISGVLIVALRSFKYGMLSLIPNLMPFAIGFGIWGITSGEINVGLSTVFGMTLGIVVDDTVHLLTKYLRARREQNKSPEDAVRYAFSTVGQAIVVTTIVLVTGFLILSFSSFKMNAQMGLLTAMVIVSALVIDLLLLPAILIRANKKSDASESSFAEKELSLGFEK